MPRLPKRNKFGAIKTVVDGITFDSRKEARRYLELKEQVKSGLVDSFELQPKYLLQESFKKDGKTIRAINYIADFEIFYADGTIVVEDSKGIETDVFKLKRKLWEYKYRDMRLVVS